ncbi:DUF3616 domain-containing protein [Bradyrhizobium liaoningense]|uniref:DUF3616 domain-containing protein n=1 Tax=Bradyrhizobium liaoningense TaxID=43992 RepID=UPI001BAD93BB|nr:DUF3616 domain-containing protein [Bradyrhizobium liaoningense]MBR0904400.1 DUF3616 domain-containing protein [Bradyrhizobium liaoningense]
MPYSITRAIHRIRTAALVCILLGATTPGGRGEHLPPNVTPEATTWTPVSIFKENEKKEKFKDQPRMNLSGAACVPTTPKFTSCLIANDEKKYAQFFSIEGNALVPRNLILLSDEEKDPDAEGVAYDDGFFYVTGSHGRSRHSDKKNLSSYTVFRIAVDPQTGVPKTKPDANRVDGVEQSSRLRKVLKNDDDVEAYFNESLAEGGINIEGIAVRNGRMYLGLRGPSLKRRAYVLSVNADALFTKHDDLKPRARSLELGKDAGIRDLAVVRDGLLILAGPTRDEDVPYSVWLWDGSSEAAKPLATLDLSKVKEGAKAEILLPLEEDAAGIRVLVMFDGVENGGAISFKIKR